MGGFSKGELRALLKGYLERQGLEPWQLEMANSSEDILKDLIKDSRRSNNTTSGPSAIAKPTDAPVRYGEPLPVNRSGWRDAQPLTTPPGTDLLDKMFGGRVPRPKPASECEGKRKEPEDANRRRIHRQLSSD